MNDKKIISFIIPIYNSAENLHVSLGSVVGFIKNIDRIECIIVNDGSLEHETNRINEIIVEYKNLGLSVTYLYQNNCGVSSARNLGINHSRGKYLYFLDSDDSITQDLLDVIEGIKDKFCHLYFNLCINKTVVRHGLLGLTRVSEDVFLSLFQKRVIHLSSLIFNRDLLRDIKFSTKYSNAEDILFLYKALINNPTFFYNNNIASYNYDGKLHRATNSGYVELIELTKGCKLNHAFVTAFEQRKYLHNSFFNREFVIKLHAIPIKMRILGMLGSMRLYMLIQKIRYK